MFTDKAARINDVLLTPFAGHTKLTQDIAQSLPQLILARILLCAILQGENTAYCGKHLFIFYLIFGVAYHLADLNAVNRLLNIEIGARRIRTSYHLFG